MHAADKPQIIVARSPAEIYTGSSVNAVVPYNLVNFLNSARSAGDGSASDLSVLVLSQACTH